MFFIFKIMTARLALRYSTSMAVKLGESHHVKGIFLHGDSRLSGRRKRLHEDRAGAGGYNIMPGDKSLVALSRGPC